MNFFNFFILKEIITHQNLDPHNRDLQLIFKILSLFFIYYKKEIPSSSNFQQNLW